MTDNYYIDNEKLDFPIAVKNLGKDFDVEESWIQTAYNDDLNCFETPLIYKGAEVGTLGIYSTSKENEIHSDYASNILICSSYVKQNVNIAVCGITLGMTEKELQKFTFSDCEQKKKDCNAYIWENDNVFFIAFLSGLESDENKVESIYVCNRRK